jgi:hypothetical protein
MIVDELHIDWAIRTPSEADPKLVVDTDGVLTCALPLECLETVVRWNAQIRQDLRSMQHSKLALGHASERLPLRLAPLTREQGGGVLAAERANHNTASVAVIMRYVKRNGNSKAKHMTKLIPSPENAARSVILAATAQHVVGGEYFGPGGLFELGGEPKEARLNPITTDAVLGKLLWQLTEALTGVSHLPDQEPQLRPDLAPERLSAG